MENLKTCNNGIESDGKKPLRLMPNSFAHSGQGKGYRMKYILRVTQVIVLSLFFILSLTACGGGDGGDGGGPTPTPAFTTADLSGTWYIYGASSGGSNPGTIRGTIVFNTSGQFTGGSYIHSDGTVASLTGGTAIINGSGVISGTATTDVGVEVSIVSGKMNSSKNIVSFVDSTNHGEFDFIFAVKGN